MKRVATNEVQDFEVEHQNLVRKLAPESMVLLKNDNQLLPLANLKRVALYGNGARNTIKGGTGSGDVNVRHFVTVEEGLENAGIQITTKSWLEAYSELKAAYEKKYYADLQEEAKANGENDMMAMMGKMPVELDYDLPLSDEDADAAVYVLARNSGEGADRKIAAGDIKLTKTEIRDITKLAEKYDKFVLVLNVGGLVDLDPVADKVPTILLMSQLGTATGDALADVLTGKAYPSGKLTMTWAPIEKYPSTANFGDINDTPYKEGIYVGYRYFDTMKIKPTYEFGYGLSYTDFEYQTEEVKADSESVSVKVKVKNTGNYNGKEVIQVYYSAPSTLIDQPSQNLAAYAKTKELKPGEEEELTISFKTAAMASYLEDRASNVLAHGQYLIAVGTSSQDTSIVAKLDLDKDTVVEKFKNIGGKVDFKDFVPKESLGEDLVDVPEISLKSADFNQVVHQYEKPSFDTTDISTKIMWDEVVAGEKTVEEFVASLSNDELVTLLTGNYTDGEGLAVIGNASSSVAGAAGETTHKLEKFNVPALTMADGPAGIRLSTVYSLDNEGNAHPVTSQFEGMQGAEQAKTNDNEKHYYQYCTAIPIGTAIAQSWNPEVAEQYGDLVGSEMELFGINIWLAPALNIQRSPLDGRDFEYYSEDPLISGLTAAAVTNGVQKHPGCVTTIKHFASNNQETNRYFSNSIVSERALREIYLKGFEIAVKTSHPLTIMTSYNLINGTHSCSRYDLLTEVARDEWGFNGFIMTDWLVTFAMLPNKGKYTTASPSQTIAAGNDMIMPGLKSDTEGILKAVENGKLSREELEVAADRILNVIFKLTK